MEPGDRITELLLTLQQVLHAAQSVAPETGQGLADALTSHLGCDVGSLCRSQ